MSENGICPACGVMGIRCGLHDCASDMLATLKWLVHNNYLSSGDPLNKVKEVISKSERKS